MSALHLFKYSSNTAMLSEEASQTHHQSRNQCHPSRVTYTAPASDVEMQTNARWRHHHREDIESHRIREEHSSNDKAFASLQHPWLSELFCRLNGNVRWWNYTANQHQQRHQWRSQHQCKLLPTQHFAADGNRLTTESSKRHQAKALNNIWWNVCMLPNSDNIQFHSVRSNHRHWQHVPHRDRKSRLQNSAMLMTLGEE